MIIAFDLVARSFGIQGRDRNPVDHVQFKMYTNCGILSCLADTANLIDVAFTPNPEEPSVLRIWHAGP